jgi:nicotinate (nicotinamide) nucleotide adenylyltransferase
MGQTYLGGQGRSKTIAEANEELQRARKRIAVFGGSFNPITNAHLNCAAEIIHSKLADEVWITPCGTRPDKPSLKTPGLHRLIMCHLAVDTTFGSRFGVKVCDEEMKEPRNIPTIVLMRKLKAKHPNYDFSFVVGSDLIPTLHEWDAPGCEGRWEAIPDAGNLFVEENHFLVIERPGEEGAEANTTPLTSNFEQIAPALEARGSRLTETLLSSSEVRHRMRGADDVVRYGMRKGLKTGTDPKNQASPISETRSWYDEVEGLVPPSVRARANTAATPPPLVTPLLVPLPPPRAASHSSRPLTCTHAAHERCPADTHATHERCRTDLCLDRVGAPPVPSALRVQVLGHIVRYGLYSREDGPQSD